MQYTITYSGLTSNDPEGDVDPATKPIIFDADRLIPHEWAFRRRANSKWEHCELNLLDCCVGGGWWFDYEGRIRIAECDRFVSLAPGESWSHTVNVGQVLPSDLLVGDEIRYQVDGYVFKMWNWGSKDEHAQTVLMHHNDGTNYGFNAPGWTDRPPMVLPSSNSLEFTIVE